MSSPAAPQLLDARYQWRTPVVVATMAMLFCLAVLIRNQPPGLWSAAAAVVAVWLVFLAVVWRRTRAQLGFAGSRLQVRTFRTVREVEGRDVLAVQESLTPSGASHRLTVRNPDGPSRRVAVPTAMMHKGHSTLFAWILTYAAQAQLDRGSHRTLADLRERGLLPSGLTEPAGSGDAPPAAPSTSPTGKGHLRRG